MKKPPTNTAHSIRDRLLKAAKANGEEFTYALTRYGAGFGHRERSSRTIVNTRFGPS